MALAPARPDAPLVIKVGGDAIADPAVRATVAADLAALQAAGRSAVVVHGGGAQATALAERLGVPRDVVAGRRITDAATLEVMKMAVAGQASVDLCAALRAAGARAVGLAGVSAGIVDAVKRPPRRVAGGGDEPIDFGHVGDVAAVGTEALESLAAAGLLPVVACLGADAAGDVYNINADIVASRLADALGARLFLLTGASGVLADPDDPASRVPRLDRAGFATAAADGSVRAGMLPKLEESFRMLAAGRVPAVHIVPAAEAGAVQRELAAPGSVGTVLEP